MDNRFLRTEMLIGKENLRYLQDVHVAVFGLGGVGSFCAEALARSGIGNITLIDFDTIDLTNINRQIEALKNTIGLYKTKVMEERILNINPEMNITTISDKYTKETREKFFNKKYDYILDAIDFLEGKIDLALQSYQRQIPIISSMGTGNKLHPEKFTIADIYETSVCPVARIMRRELKKLHVPSLKVVYSTEEPIKPKNMSKFSEHKIGSISFVPPVVGFIMAGEVIRDLLKNL